MGRTRSQPEFASQELALLRTILDARSQDNLNPQLQDAVFVCIDCEAFEDDQQKITEIGIAALDTRDLLDVPSGEKAEDWLTKIRYAHYRPIEHMKLVNRRFVQGCEDRFGFGTTCWINLADAQKVLQRVFLDPTRLDEAASFDADVVDCRRNIIVIGHSMRGDKEYLSQVGFSIADVANVVRIMDTQTLAGGTKKHRIGLHRLMLNLGLQPVNLHNAGNDAGYTLQALILMAFQDSKIPGHVFNPSETRTNKLPSPVHTQKQAQHVFAGSISQSQIHARHTDTCTSMSDGQIVPSLKESASVSTPSDRASIPEKRKLPAILDTAEPSRTSKYARSPQSLERDATNDRTLQAHSKARG